MNQTNPSQSILDEAIDLIRRRCPYAERHFLNELPGFVR
jgi:hypothetical protein